MNRFVSVQFLRPGDLVDLQHDPFADPQSRHPLFEFEGAVVSSVERETPSCVAVCFEGFDVVGFPAHHRLRVLRREARGHQ